MNKKVLICILLIFTVLSLPLCRDAVYAAKTDTGPRLWTEAYILIDANTGESICEKNADKAMYPASITKVMTAIIAIENGDFSRPFAASSNAIKNIGIGGSVAGLRVGEEVYLDDLLYMLLLPSGNDAANVIAENVAGSIEAFVEMMNDKAREIGALNTHFTNPIGLDAGDGHPDHKITARDFATISRYAMSLEKFRKVSGTAQYTMPDTNKHKKWGIKTNTNRFLTYMYYDKSLYQVNGGKTGCTGAAGNTLVISAKNKDNVELICVLLRNYDRNQIFLEAKKLLDYGFSLVKDKKLDICGGFYDMRFRDSKDIVRSFCDSGYMSGYDDNSFKPTQMAAREEFITAFMKMSSESFRRADKSQCRQLFDSAASLGLIEPGWYNERSMPIKRDEAAEIMKRYIDRSICDRFPGLSKYSTILKDSIEKQILTLFDSSLLPDMAVSDTLTREGTAVLLSEYFKTSPDHRFLKNLADSKTKRLGGSNRFTAAAAISREGWSTSENVVLVNGYSRSDTLSAAAFAHAKNAPMLFASPTSISAHTLNEIKRLKAENIFIVGDTDAVSVKTEESLSIKYNVIRIAGSSHQDTAVKTADYLAGIADCDTIMLVSYNKIAEALPAAAYSAQARQPVLYTERNRLPDNVKAYIEKYGITNAVLIGGDTLISGGVEDNLKDLGLTTTRISGNSQYEISLNLAKNYLTGTYESTAVFSGQDFAGATAGAVLAAKLNMPFIALKEDNNPCKSFEFIDTYSSSRAYLLGGTDTISEAEREQIAICMMNETYNTALKAPANTGLTFSSGKGIVLGWDAVPDALVYNIYRSTDKYGPYIKICETADNSFPDVCTGSDACWYKITASNSSGEGIPTGPVNIKLNEESMPALYSIPRLVTSVAGALLNLNSALPDVFRNSEVIRNLLIVDAGIKVSYGFI